MTALPQVFRQCRQFLGQKIFLWPQRYDNFGIVGYAAGEE